MRLWFDGFAGDLSGYGLVVRGADVMFLLEMEYSVLVLVLDGFLIRESV